MKKTDAEKKFDCVEFKRQAQARIYERIKNLTPDEEIEYFRKAAETGPFGDWWRRTVTRVPETGAEGSSRPSSRGVGRRSV
jgi:hypothetical protein